MSQDLTPSRPYLMRALNDWILDNDCTPYVLVDASIPGVVVPDDYINNGQIVLNINPSAVRDLLINQEGLFFNARFGGVPMDVYVPMIAVLAIYAKENGQGMVFGSEAGAPDPNDPKPTSNKLTAKTNPEKPTGKSNNVVKPMLKIIK